MHCSSPPHSADHAETLALTTRSAAETEALGALLAPLLRAGDVLPLWGGFGAGKTTFVRGVGRGLGVASPMVSPSFGLVHSVRGAGDRGLLLHHLDLYRVDSAEEAVGFGIEEALGGEGAALVEWPHVIEPLLPTARLDVRFEPGDGDDERRIAFEARADRPGELLRVLARAVEHR